MRSYRTAFDGLVAARYGQDFLRFLEENRPEAPESWPDRCGAEKRRELYGFRAQKSAVSFFTDERERLDLLFREYRRERPVSGSGAL